MRSMLLLMVSCLGLSGCFYIPGHSHELSVVIEGSGGVAADFGASCIESCTREHSYVEGYMLHEMCASPAPGWRLDRWEGDCGGRTETCVQIDIDNGDVTCKVVFVRADGEQPSAGEGPRR